GDAAQPHEHDVRLARVRPQRIVGAAGHDELGELRREEALEPAQALELGYLFGDAPLERLVPLRQLAPITRLLIVEPLLLQAGADPGLEQDRVERVWEAGPGARRGVAAHSAR